MKSKRTPKADLQEITPILLGIWRRMHKLAGPADKLQTREFRSVVAAVKHLMEMSIDGKTLIGTDYFANPDLLGAHILYDWVVHYQQALSIFGEPPKTASRVLDLCSGAAPSAFAALRHGADEVIAIDKSRAALQYAGEIAGRYGNTLTVRTHDVLKPLPVEGKFDLICLSHCLEELFPSNAKGWADRQYTFIQQLLTRLTQDGHLVLIDSSQPDSNQRILSLRDRLVSAGVPVQAPCVWQGECPALKTPNSPCYAQREFEKSYIVKEIQRAAAINLNSLKMTYLILRNPQQGWPTPSFVPCYRVISPPVDTFSGKRFYLCGTDGKKQLGSHLSEHPAESRAFEYLKRGELIAFEGALETGHAIDIVEDTKVHVIAPVGKPLPEKAHQPQDSDE